MSADNNLVVIYVRVSSDKQRVEDSCADQERKVREGLDARGICHSQAYVIQEKAISGTIENRPGLNELRKLVTSRRVSVVAVDELSRLSRGPFVQGVVTDIRFYGGRFLSMRESIDSNAGNWEALVCIFGLGNSTSSKETAHRVRRGLEGRFLDGNGSVGLPPYGYKSAPVEPDWRALLASGKRPKMKVVIDEAEAKVVQSIFEAVAHLKMGPRQIMQHLVKQGVPPGGQAKSGHWNTCRVRAMVVNPKYIGVWVWGANETVRSAEGTRRLRKTVDHKPAVSMRPDLRIISDELWEAAQQEVRRRSDLYTVGKQKRNPRMVNVPSNIAGLVACGYCGRPLSSTMFKKWGRFMFCGTHLRSTCSLSRWVKVQRVEEAIFGLLTTVCQEWPEWLAEMLQAMRERILCQPSIDPTEIREKESRLTIVNEQSKNIADQIAEGHVRIKAIDAKLHALEQEATLLQTEIRQLKQRVSAPRELPDDVWVKKELMTLAERIATPSPAAAAELASIITSAKAFEVDSLGKQRGLELRVTLDIPQFIIAALRSESSVAFGDCSESSSQEFILELTPRSNSRTWGQKLEEMKNSGASWKEMASATGLSVKVAQHTLATWLKLVERKTPFVPSWESQGGTLHALRQRGLQWSEIAAHLGITKYAVQLKYYWWCRKTGTRRFEDFAPDVWGPKIQDLRDQGKTFRQIAAELGLTLSKVESRYSKWKKVSKSSVASQAATGASCSRNKASDGPPRCGCAGGGLNMDPQDP